MFKIKTTHGIQKYFLMFKNSPLWRGALLGGVVTLMNLKQLSPFKWEITCDNKGMKVPGIIFTNEDLNKNKDSVEALKQVENVAHLPGIVKASFAMPDMHWGYGFPIGGVAATDPENGGVISPGGVGFDINCGVRLIKTNLNFKDIQKNIPSLINMLFANIPCGIGSSGDVKLSYQDENKVMQQGVTWAKKQGYAEQNDITNTENNGCMESADPNFVSDRARERGKNQLGSLGSGNHFLEIQVIDKILNHKEAQKFGFFEGQVMIMIHSGSRGLGHQICDDYIKLMRKASEKYGYNLPDAQLCCAPVNSPEGKNYFSAMSCAANYAWVNRQILMIKTFEIFEKFFKQGRHALGLSLVYDICHNIAKLEEHLVDGKKKLLCVHRKGATRSFPETPVLIPGSMGTHSFFALGTQKALDETFGSTCHGAGRILSRTQAIKQLKGKNLSKELESQGIYVQASSRETLSEEAPCAYKNVTEVVSTVSQAGLAELVIRLKPVGCIKG